MASRRAWCAAWAMSLCLWTQDSPTQTLPQTLTDTLRVMTEMAGVIFTGQVVAVRPQERCGTVEIDFTVDSAVRGVSGGTFTLREWAGLWPASDEPFLVGQQYLMLLHSPGAGGLSSPVAGMDGAIPILAEVDPAVRAGAAPRQQGRGEDAVTIHRREVDLSWINTHAVQAVIYQPLAVRGPSAGPITVHAELAAPINAGYAQIAYVQQRMEVGAVVDMLRTWERSAHGNR